MNPFNLTGRVALVTGGATGIGAAISTGLAHAGADVAVTVHATPARDTRSSVEGAGCRFTEVRANLAAANGAREVLAQVEADLGAVDILVNNAGIIRRADAQAYSEADWSDVLGVNLSAAWGLCQAAGQAMLARGHGKIINVVSLLAFQGGIRVPAYTASKHALAGLTKALANEWAAQGVNVNAIAPGYIATNNTTALREDETRAKQILERIPAGRWGEPSDLTGAAVFLASSAADYVHGHVLVVDGGWLAR